MTGPLAGVRVLELGSFIAGPFAGQLLADYGAEVIKVEPPEAGDAMRRWGHTLDGESLWWPTIARGKRSVALDLRDEAARAVLRELAAEVDVILENFRPGVLAEWGLDHATLSRTNPGLVVVHVSGYGQTGPRAREAGFGSIGEVSMAVSHLDQLTQQNAALVEESAAAAEALKQQAERLAAAVGAFRLAG